ncbi:MAG: hypothetical protein M3N14_07450, partial [Bacteroidota bacterium]|nr:hypothetical protein [Bacteroidota bacterium]
INPRDVAYIFSQKGRYTWFNNLQKRPIKLNNKFNPDGVWADHELKRSLLRTAMDKVNYYQSRLIQILKKSE